MPAKSLCSLRKRAHAWLLAHAGSAHDRIVAERKKRLLGSLHGRICEIGPGTGVNFGYYPLDSTIVCIEPNPYLHGPASEAAGKHGITAHCVIAEGERLPLAADSCDAVVTTLVLCSVDDQAKVLSEICRVLKPGGTFRFVEHVAAERGSLLNTLQSLIKPVWSMAGDGCKPDRDTAAALQASDLEIVELERFNVPIPIVGPHIAGIGRKRAEELQ